MRSPWRRLALVHVPRYNPLYLSPLAAITAQHVSLAATLVPAAPALMLSFVFAHPALWVAAAAAATGATGGTGGAARSDAPAARRFAPLLADTRVTLDIRTQADTLAVTLGNEDLVVTARADAFNAFIDLVSAAPRWCRPRVTA